MVKRFDGRVADVLNTTHRTSRDDLQTPLNRVAYLYNHHILQKALNHRTPIQALQHWQREKPESLRLFGIFRNGAQRLVFSDSNERLLAFQVELNTLE